MLSNVVCPIYKNICNIFRCAFDRGILFYAFFIFGTYLAPHIIYKRYSIFFEYFKAKLLKVPVFERLEFDVIPCHIQSNYSTNEKYFPFVHAKHEKHSIDVNHIRNHTSIECLHFYVTQMLF